MARNLNKEQRSFLIAKAVQVIIDRVAPINVRETALGKKVKEKRIDQAYRSLCRNPEQAIATGQACGNQFTFSIKMRDMPKSTYEIGFHNVDIVNPDRWTRTTLQYSGPISKSLVQRSAKLLEDFNGRLIMQNVEGADDFLAKFIEAVKRLK